MPNMAHFVGASFDKLSDEGPARCFRRRVVEKFVASLLVARASGPGRRCGRLWRRALVDERDAVRGYVHEGHPDLPIIGLTNKND